MSTSQTVSTRVTVPVVSRYWHPHHVDPTEKAAAIRRVLALARENLAMDVGYFGTFEGGEQTYEVVEGQRTNGSRVGPLEGSRLPVDQTLCWQVVSGRMGSLVPDTKLERVTRDLFPVTDENVGAYLGVPVHVDGELLGMLCLIASEARPGLAAPDLATMRLFAQVVALELTDGRGTDAKERAELDALKEALDPASDDPVVVFQPTASISSWLHDRTLEVRSVEALSRFSADPALPVEHWFDLAWRNGLGVDLEMAAIERAFDALPLLPEPIRLGVNASPETIVSSRLRDAIPLDQAHRITLELTEHVLIEDYDTLRPGLERVRATGVKLAIDDLGTGSSNLQHLIELSPELIKVDLSITNGVEYDRRRRALVSALVSFARDTGIVLVAEGVERLATARQLELLGVEYGQGYWFSRAMPAKALPSLAALRPAG
jgi:EAL domain-containing protein (putative c-di-GMP-specific phosphodiesterase class I)